LDEYTVGVKWLCMIAGVASDPHALWFTSCSLCYVWLSLGLPTLDPFILEDSSTPYSLLQWYE
jgi:hypothetical protein